MTKTVDIVVPGADAAAVRTILASARRGLRVLVVIRSTRTALERRLRRTLRASGEDVRRRVSIVAGAEIACADGICGVEAIVIRRIRTGQLIGVNARAIRPQTQFLA
jgi:predicted dinucleotide-utilizing enzyme